jgi:predicted lipoprotein with Yx(FWY)xxD motif
MQRRDSARGSSLTRLAPRLAILPAALIAGAALAVLAAGLATGKSFTLAVNSGGEIQSSTGTSHHALAVNGKGWAVYELAGESRHHFLCTAANGCISFWIPVTVAGKTKPSAAPGIKGRLSTVKRVLNGKTEEQVLLAGHPLYTFKGDSKRAVATGNGIKSFNGVWHAILASGGAASVGGTGTSSTPTTTTPTSTGTTPTPTSTYTYPTYSPDPTTTTTGTTPTTAATTPTTTATTPTTTGTTPTGTTPW